MANWPRIKPFFVHCKGMSGHDERFDTIMAPNGSVAVLSGIASGLSDEPGLAIDETWMGPAAVGREREALLALLYAEIEEGLSQGSAPLVCCSVLNYNAESTMHLLRELKHAFGNRVRTAVGGHLPSMCPEPYLHQDSIDHVCVGDAEVILPTLFYAGEGQRLIRGTKQVTPDDHYAPPYYGEYHELDSRFQEMARYRFGPFTRMRQLVTESVRGCAWANAYKVCKFCSLQGVNTAPVFRNLAEHFAIEEVLAQIYGCNWLFDVSNLWLPTTNTMQAVLWLQNYVRQRRLLAVSDIHRYVYLTANVITQQTAPLLRQAGVRATYIGLDGWNEETRRALYKPNVSAWRPLSACRDSDILVRASLVIGSGLSRATLEELPAFVAETLAEFPNTLHSLGNIIEIVLPGSEDWVEFERRAQTEHITAAVDLFNHFQSEGYLTLDQEERLNEIRIRHSERQVEFEEVVAARDRAVEIVKGSATLSVTMRESEKLDHV